MKKKITLIGAGSVTFAKKLVGDILQYPELSSFEICLMDIDPQRLKVAKVMTERTIEVLNVSATVSATLDRTEAIRGASYVICTIQIGGYRPSTVRDFEIPANYGLKQTIGDTLGVGGVFRALRTIPAIVRIAEDIAAVGARDCILLNYTNPMAMNCRAVDRAVGIPHVGLCHSVQGTSARLAAFSGIPYEDVTYLVAGINHMAYFLEFRYKGQDAYPLLFKALENPALESLDKVRFEMMRRTGYFVTESSEHTSEYVPYFIHHGDSVIKEYSIPIDEYPRRCEAILATWQKDEKDLLGEGEGKRFEVKERSSEYGSHIILAKETNQPAVIYGNVPNRGLINNLTQGACVEVPCLVDANGIQPTVIGDMPKHLAALCQTNVNVQELTVEAALTKKREHIYHAVMLDPHTAATLPLDKIWSMCDELLEAHQKDGFLGSFEPVIQGTGRSFAGTGDRLFASVEADGSFSRHAGSVNKMLVRVENPGFQEVKISLNLGLNISLESAELDIPTINLTLPPESEVSEPFTLRVKKELKDVVQLDLESDDENVLCRGLTLHPRTVLTADKDNKIPFGMKLDGQDAVRGSLARAGEILRIDLLVMDSDVQPAETSEMRIRNGSGTEFLFTPDDQTPLIPIRLIPGSPGRESEAKVTDQCDRPIEGATIKQQTTTMDYKLIADIPLAAVGLNPQSTSVFVEVETFLTALGSAHSGGKTSLLGTMRKKVFSPYLYEFRFR